MTFRGAADYSHRESAAIGVLLVNLGTPDAPTAAAVRPYLRRFLSDPRVIEMPRALWWCILNLFILPFRPRRTAEAYHSIWQPEGSPLLLISQRLQQALQKQLAQQQPAIRVALAMSYSEPSIGNALTALQKQNCRYLAVLPLYPQYAASTVGSVFDDVCRNLMRWRFVPHLRFISGYSNDPRYIRLLADSVTAFRRRHGSADKLIFSFHGTPLKMLTDGDPYHCFCHQTARLTAAALGLNDNDWMITFQSRFGKAVWLQPYTDETLRALPAQGIKNVQIISPAFAADCLETLEELAVENRDCFMAAGGDSYAYIPALNDDAPHINFLADLLLDSTGDWQTALARGNAQLSQQRQRYDSVRQARADFYNSESSAGE